MKLNPRAQCGAMRRDSNPKHHWWELPEPSEGQGHGYVQLISECKVFHRYNPWRVFTSPKYFSQRSQSMRQNSLKNANGGTCFDKYYKPNSLVGFQRELFCFPIISKQRNSILYHLLHFRTYLLVLVLITMSLVWWKIAPQHLNCKTWLLGKKGFLRR